MSESNQQLTEAEKLIMQSVTRIGDRMSAFDDRMSVLADHMSVLADHTREFQTAVISRLTHLTEVVSKLEVRMDDLSITVNKLSNTIRLVYCRPGMTERLLGNIDACAGLVTCSCRNVVASSRMSVSEIVADFEVNKRGDNQVGNLGGDCQAAARAAEQYFNDHHSLMLPKFEECVMYSPSGASFTQATVGWQHPNLPTMDGHVTPNMTAHTLKAGTCVWEPVALPVQVCAKGHKHFVTSVTTLEGSKVAVDWGIGQFAQLPHDMMLFF